MRRGVCWLACVLAVAATVLLAGLLAETQDPLHSGQVSLLGGGQPGTAAAAGGAAGGAAAIGGAAAAAAGSGGGAAAGGGGGGKGRGGAAAAAAAAAGNGGGGGGAESSTRQPSAAERARPAAYRERAFEPPCPEWLVKRNGRCARNHKECKDQGRGRDRARGVCAGEFRHGGARDVGRFLVEDSRAWCRNGAVASLSGQRLVLCKNGDPGVLHVGGAGSGHLLCAPLVGAKCLASGGDAAATYRVPLDLPCPNPVGDLRPFTYRGQLFVIGQTGQQIGKGRPCLQELYRQAARYVVDEAARRSFGSHIQNFVVRLQPMLGPARRLGASQAPKPLPVTYLNFHWSPGQMLRSPAPNFNKNFMPFEWNGNLYMVTKVFPHIVHRTDLTNGFMKLAFWTECEVPRFSSGAEFVGGSSSPLAISFGGKPVFLAVAHTALEGWGTLRKTIFYVFSAEPPFRITHATDEFDYGMAATEYATSFLLDGPDVLLSVGVADRSWALIRQGLWTILDRMSPVRTLKRRAIPEEWWDKSYDFSHHRFRNATL